MVKSAGRKRLVGYLQSEYHVSQRRACRLIAISRKAIWYQSVRPDRDADLIKRLKQLAEQYPRYGYLMLHELQQIGQALAAHVNACHVKSRTKRGEIDAANTEAELDAITW